ncbi:MAG: universal stress protein [Micrococcales bacterium]|nr:universal stress protein [Micrococcales bacterium]
MTVLVGYIPNAYGEAALTAAVEEAKRRTERLLVVNQVRDDRLADSHRAGADQLEIIRRDLEEAGLDFEVRVVDHGSDPAEELLEVARAEHVSVIVIGMRHRSPVGKLLLGSSAQRILLDAPCQVLAVKPA